MTSLKPHALLFVAIALTGWSASEAQEANAVRTFGARFMTSSPNKVSGVVYLPPEIDLEEMTITTMVTRGKDRAGVLLTLERSHYNRDLGSNVSKFCGKFLLPQGSPHFPHGGPYEATVDLGVALSTMTVTAVIHTREGSETQPAQVEGVLMLPKGWVVTTSFTEEPILAEAVVTRGSQSVGTILVLFPTSPQGETRFTGDAFGVPLPAAGPLGASITIFLPVHVSP